MKKTNKKGFTIVELVIVIAVIAILAAVLIPTFSGVVTKAKDSAATQACRNAYTELLAATNATPRAATYALSATLESNSITGTAATGDPTKAELQAIYNDTHVTSITVASDLWTFVLPGYTSVTYVPSTGVWTLTPATT